MVTLECSALLFDLDDTLVLSTPSIEASWHEFTDRYGIDFDTVRKLLPGRRGRDILSTIMPELTAEQVADELKTIRCNEIAAATTIMPVPGAATLIHSLPRHRWAVVTAAPRKVMESRLYGAGLPIPAVAVCAENVREGKPSPEGFLVAAQELAADPAHCLAFEDSAVGFRALKEAKIMTVAIGKSPHVHGCDIIASIPDYEGIMIKEMDSCIRIVVP